MESSWRHPDFRLHFCEGATKNRAGVYNPSPFVYVSRMPSLPPPSPTVYSDATFVAHVGDPAAFLSLLDAMPEVAIYAKDLEGRFTMANAAELRIIGVSRPEAAGQ